MASCNPDVKLIHFCSLCWESFEGISYHAAHLDILMLKRPNQCRKLLEEAKANENTTHNFKDIWKLKEIFPNCNNHICMPLNTFIIFFLSSHPKNFAWKEGGIWKKNPSFESLSESTYLFRYFRILKISGFPWESSGKWWGNVGMEGLNGDIYPINDQGNNRCLSGWLLRGLHPKGAPHHFPYDSSYDYDIFFSSKKPLCIVCAYMVILREFPL